MDNRHTDMIHDASLDYYGRRLATASSDRTVQIFEVDGDVQRHVETLKGHEGPVFCVAWAHPTFGTLLASSSYDGKVAIWRESPPSSTSVYTTGTWSRIYESSIHSASVNLLAWAPREYGCMLACASSDGEVSVLRAEEGADALKWVENKFTAHPLGVNAVSWAPPAKNVDEDGDVTESTYQVVTAGNDQTVKIWGYSPFSQTSKLLKDLQGHSDTVHDVSWSPSVLPTTYIASASADKTVRIWKTSSSASSPSSTSNQEEWTCSILPFDKEMWRVSWNWNGNVLAVGGGNDEITLWLENLKGEWERVKGFGQSS